MTAWRCFVGLPLPEAYQQGLERARQAARGLRSGLSWTRPGNWHLTLRFLGDVDQAAVPRVVAALTAVDWRAFAMRAGRAGFFPPQDGRAPRPPRVVWLGLDQGAAECARLAQEVETALEPLGFVQEKRAFAAHLTVARVKRPERDDWSALARALTGLPWPVFTADEMILWRSELGPQGPTYTRLASFQPAGSAEGR